MPGNDPKTITIPPAIHSIKVPKKEHPLNLNNMGNDIKIPKKGGGTKCLCSFKVVTIYHSYSLIVDISQFMDLMQLNLSY